MGIKLKRVEKLGNWHKGRATTSDVLNRLPQDVINALPSKILVQVANAIDKAYHDGKTSAGAEMVDSNCVWINSLNSGVEWVEKDAEYETVTTTENGFKVTKPVKVKDGALVFTQLNAKNV